MMDMQAAPPTYAEMNTGQPPVGNPPMLGQQVPGMTGGLPSQGGLSVLANPMAEQLRSFGRGDDSMLVHMTPGEVNSLQGLAMATGGSLTINPQTGLPEAGWLGKLLPTILGAALAATGVGAPLAAGIVGAGQFARTGSLKKGLMAGLGAFGGAGMAGMAGLGGKLSETGFGLLGDKAGFFGANMGQGISQGANALGELAKLGTPAVENAVNVTAKGAVTGAPGGYAGAFSDKVIPGIGSGTAGAANPAALLSGGPIGSGTQAALTGVAPTATTATTGAQFTGGLGSRFGQAVRAGLPGGTPGIVSKAAPMLAASGVLQGVSGAMTPSMGTMGSNGMMDNSYQGPYTAQKRTPSFAKDTSEILGSSKERRYFDIDMPEVYNTQGQIVQPGSSTAPGTPIMQNYLLPTNKKTPKGSPMYGQRFVPYMGEQEEGFADGGEVELADGAFVLDARTVSELGNGSSNAGLEALRRIGGRPIQGPGDGVSDSIPARIGRKQPARVARDEAIIPAEAVRKIGKGNPKRGADKLYALMDKAHKARKKAKRGQDTKLRRGLV